MYRSSIVGDCIALPFAGFLSVAGCVRPLVSVHMAVRVWSGVRIDDVLLVEFLSGKEWCLTSPLVA